MAQVAARVRLIAAGTGAFSLDQPAFRVRRFVLDVLLQRQTIRERPVVGVAHALVFWGFVAFAGYTAVEFLRGLGIVDLTQLERVPRVPRRPGAVCRRRSRSASSSC